MSDRDPAAGHSARLLRGLVWTGVLLAPAAAVVVLLGGSSQSVRFAVLLLAVSVVLVGASILIRTDPVLRRMDIEDRVAEEVAALRSELRAEFARGPAGAVPAVPRPRRSGSEPTPTAGGPPPEPAVAAGARGRQRAAGAGVWLPAGGAGGRQPAAGAGGRASVPVGVVSAAASVRPGTQYGHPRATNGDLGSSNGYAEVGAPVPGGATYGRPAGSTYETAGDAYRPGDSANGSVGNTYGSAAEAYGASDDGYGDHAGVYGPAGSEYGTEEAGYGLTDAGYGLTDAGYGSADAGYGSAHAGYGSTHAGYGRTGNIDDSGNTFRDGGAFESDGTYRDEGADERDGRYGAGGYIDAEGYGLVGGYDGPGRPSGDPGYRARRHRPSANDTNVGTFADFASSGGYRDPVPDERYVQDYDRPGTRGGGW
jgi:hypothetical protein